jgi:hypothetical protein
MDANAHDFFAYWPDGNALAGTVHRFSRQGSIWGFAEELVSANGGAHDLFGWAISPDSASSRVAIGAPYDDDPVHGVDAGTVRIVELPCAAPVAYCTAKTNSAGCAPPIGYAGIASLSSGSGFTISASQILAQTSGALIYGLGGRTALPFQGGTMCFLPPRRRTPLQSSAGGAMHTCTGAFAFDFNVWAATSGDPALAPGQRVQAQFWSRDPLSVPPAGLTEALDFYLAP